MDLESLNELLRKNLSSLMAEKELTASGWAKAAGLSHTAVRDVILGKVKTPTYATLRALAHAANVDDRRITIGPNYSNADELDPELIDLWSQLEPHEREFLINSARGQIASRR